MPSRPKITTATQFVLWIRHGGGSMSAAVREVESFAARQGARTQRTGSGGAR